MGDLPRIGIKEIASAFCMGKFRWRAPKDHGHFEITHYDRPNTNSDLTRGCVLAHKSLPRCHVQPEHVETNLKEKEVPVQEKLDENTHCNNPLLNEIIESNLHTHFNDGRNFSSDYARHCCTYFAEQVSREILRATGISTATLMCVIDTPRVEAMNHKNILTEYRCYHNGYHIACVVYGT